MPKLNLLASIKRLFIEVIAFAWRSIRLCFNNISKWRVSREIFCGFFTQYSLLQQEYRSQSLELNVESDFSLYYRLNVMILTRKINFLIQRQSYVSWIKWKMNFSLDLLREWLRFCLPAIGNHRVQRTLLETAISTGW